jgi:hypothetical protein
VIDGRIPIRAQARLLQKYGRDDETKDYATVVELKAPEFYCEYMRHIYDHSPNEGLKQWVIDRARKDIPRIAAIAPGSAVELIEWVMAKTNAKDLVIDKIGEALPSLAESLGQKWALDFALRTLVDANVPFDGREAPSYNPDGFLTTSPKSTFCAARLGAATPTERTGIFRMAGYLVHSLAKHSPRLAEILSAWSSRNAREQKSTFFNALCRQVQKDIVPSQN